MNGGETGSPDRPFGLWTATAMVVGSMIGSGIFLLPASLAPYGWVGVVAWVLASAGALVIAYVLVRLSRVLPLASGGIGIVGETLGPIAGALIGWSYWVSTWSANAAIATAASSYLSVLIPPLSATPLRGALTASALIWALTALNLAGARAAGRFQVVTTILKVVPLATVAIILATLGVSGKGHVLPQPPMPLSFAGLTAPLTLTLFALLGFECASLIAARVQRPEVNIFRATMFGSGLAALFYVVVCSGIVLTLPTAVVANSPAPFATFVETFLGHWPAVAVTLFAAIAAIGALNGWVLIQGEIPRGMAVEGLLPAWFGRTDCRDVPVGVLILSSALASALVMTNAAKSLSGIFEFMVLLTTASSLWFYFAACVAALRLRIAIPAAVLGLIFSVWAMWGAGIVASGLSLLLMLTVLPLYWMRGARLSSLAG
ncbi:MAG: amino acid permease [Sphingomonadales bacterium]|nr:amino acid permease [Sphingomonadales bacterium]